MIGKRNGRKRGRAAYGRRRNGNNDKSPPPRRGVAPEGTAPICCAGGADSKAFAPILRRRPFRVVIPIAVACAFTVLFVGTEVIQQRLFPNMSIGLRHALLTVRAGIATVAASLIVYLLMRRQNQRLSATAETVSRLLESSQADPLSRARFENPHLVHCRDVIDCDQSHCPMYDSPNERCWQAMGLRRASFDHETPGMEIQKCHECNVYRLSCPDKLTELGESFNNLMFLLEQEATHVGRMRDQMAEGEKMSAIGQVAAGVAHEVGNPLSSISSIVQMLKRKGAASSMVEQLDLIETHIRRISMIVKQLVSLSRPSTERWEMADVGWILEEVVRLIGFDRRAQNVEIDFQRPQLPGLTCALKGELQQVFLNLSLNALDAMPDGGTLTISATEKLGGIAVRIRDTGVGITEEAARRVFEPFFTTKDPGQGTGLGLAVSDRIVRKHGGAINFTSPAGGGTEFIVAIPRLPKKPEN